MGVRAIREYAVLVKYGNQWGLVSMADGPFSAKRTVKALSESKPGVEYQAATRLVPPWELLDSGEKVL